MHVFLLDNPEVTLTKTELDNLGVLSWKIPVETIEEDGILDGICRERNYTYKDIIKVSPDHLPNYEAKIKSFFEEHLHTDEEIRFFLGGSGYFDVRDKQDRWVRIHAATGDMIVLPAGMYHRFSTDDKNYAHVMRLFQGDPVWTPWNRGEEADAFPERATYVNWLEEQKA